MHETFLLNEPKVFSHSILTLEAKMFCSLLKRRGKPGLLLAILNECQYLLLPSR